MTSGKIGEVISASVQSGLEAKLDLRSPEELKVGYPVIVEGTQYGFFCLVHDIVNQPLEIAERLAGMRGVDSVMPVAAQEGYSGRIFYSKARLRPIQLFGREDGRLHEAETIPPYFSPVRLAREEDVGRLYGQTASSAPLGTLRGVPGFWINLDFGTLVEKPFGIFGRTGAGKSILNKLVCGGILARDTAGVFVFDMQDEYGAYSRGDNSPGLKHFFPEKVELFSLDASNREAHPFVLSSYEIEPEDLIITLLDLSDNMKDALYKIYNKMDRARQGILEAIESATEEQYPENEIHPAVLAALKRKVSRVRRFRFIKPIDGRKDAFNAMLDNIRAKKSIVLQFGEYGTDSGAYLFVANIIARRLFDMYSGPGGHSEKMPRLVIFLEEAHKFLSPQVASLTVFGRLARETRKFNLILALVDQRPSQIDDEVRSQLANRLVMSLKEPSDVSSALAGVPDRSVWEGIVSTIPVRTVMAIGDSIRVPTVIDVMDYRDEAGVRSRLAGAGAGAGGGQGPGLTSGEIDKIAGKAKALFS